MLAKEDVSDFSCILLLDKVIYVELFQYRVKELFL